MLELFAARLYCYNVLSVGGRPLESQLYHKDLELRPLCLAVPAQ